MNDLFDGLDPPLPAREDIAPGAVLLRGRALAHEAALIRRWLRSRRRRRSAT